MTLRTAVAAAVLAVALPALAQFEGVADVKMRGGYDNGQMTGTGKLFLSPAGWRMEMNMAVPQAVGQPKAGKGAAPTDHRIVTFGKRSDPKKSWMLNEKTKTYAVLEDDDDEASDDDGAEWKVTKLGQDSVAGFSCTNVRAQKEGDDEIWEGCLAKDFLAGSWFKEMQKDSDDEWWAKAAKKAGIQGYPVRLIAKTGSGKEKHRFEVVKVERRKVPASTFEVPAGYKQGGMMDVMAQTPEQQKQMEEARRQMEEQMKNMSPEQRKMMEDMMKKMGGGQKQ